MDLLEFSWGLFKSHVLTSYYINAVTEGTEIPPELRPLIPLIFNSGITCYEVPVAKDADISREVGPLKGSNSDSSCYEAPVDEGADISPKDYSLNGYSSDSTCYEVPFEDDAGFSLKAGPLKGNNRGIVLVWCKHFGHDGRYLVTSMIHSIFRESRIDL